MKYRCICNDYAGYMPDDILSFMFAYSPFVAAGPQKERTGDSPKSLIAIVRP
jgi:hypothetical protein